MEFIYDILVVVGAVCLVRGILKIPRELEVLKAGGEEGRVEVVVGHVWGTPRAVETDFKSTRPGLERRDVLTAKKINIS